jgi:hypothetical protein
LDGKFRPWVEKSIERGRAFTITNNIRSKARSER